MGGGADRCAPVCLLASDTIEQAHSLAHASAVRLIGPFTQHRAALKWEQSYTTVDREMGEDMLFNYGYAEIIGQRGPFVNTHIRAGVTSLRSCKQVKHHDKTGYTIKNMFGELKD
mgnify:CR=1 FL=1